MQQLNLVGPNKLEWRDAPEPRLQGDGEAIIRPVANARCDFDVEALLVPGAKVIVHRARETA